MTRALQEIVGRFDRARVLLIGDFMLDRYVVGDAERISPEAPVPVLRVVERSDRVGGAGSVALNLRALGAEVHCVGLLGTDGFGDRVARFLSEAGAEVSGLRRVNDRPTITKTRLVGLAEHRHRQQILRVDDEVVRPPSEGDARFLIAEVQAALPHVNVVCLEDYAKGMLSEAFCREVIRAAGAAGRPVLVDPARERDWEKYRGAALLTPNRSELEGAVGRRLVDSELPVAARELLTALEIDALVVTLGRDGALLVPRDGEARRFPTVPRAVYDNTGAGDAVLATIAAALGAGASLEEAVPLANIAGGLEVSKFGCVPISRVEILEALRNGVNGQRGKLRTVEELVPELEARRQRGETVVFTNGCFDLLHPGHVELLEKAKSLGSILVVGLNSDASVRRLGKGADRPLRREGDRARMLAALSAVDYVVVFDESEPTRLIERVRPEVLVKGADWAEKGVVGREMVEAYGGRVVLVELVEGYGTTAELERIRRAGATLS